MISAPITVPPIVPDPPERLVPPITTAAMASSSNISPRLGEAPFRREASRMPDSAASTEIVE